MSDSSMSVSDPSLGVLVNSSIGEALLETSGGDRRHVALTIGMPLWALRSDGKAPPREGKRMPAWSAAEDGYLRQNHGLISEQDIARHLGRTRNAVRLRWKRDLRLPPPSKTPGFVTASGAARLLGVDVKAVVAWIEAGLLPAHTLPFDMPRHVRRVRIFHLKRFALRPESWTLFDPQRVPDPKLGSLIRRAHERWGDRWLTTGRVADMHGLSDTGPINRRIREGTLPAIRRGGGGNWLVKRSDSERLVIRPGKGNSSGLYSWPAEADAFIVLARAVGLTYYTIARLMHWGPEYQAPYRSIFFRYHALLRNGDLPAIILEHELVNISYYVTADVLVADWPSHSRRFPYLSRIFDQLAAGHPPPDAALYDVRGVLRSWAIHHLGAAHPIVRRLGGPIHNRPAEFWTESYQQLVDCLSARRRTRS